MIRRCTFLFSLTGLLVAASSVEAAFIANLSPAAANRVRTDAVVGNSEGSATDLLGAVAGNRNHGAALLFDLSTIPDGATITSATVTFQTTGVDTNSTTDITDGSADINLFEYAIEPDTVNGWNYNAQSFGPDQDGGTADDVAWTNTGGDFTNGNSPLSSIADTSFGAPSTVPVGTTFTIPSSALLVSALQGSLGDNAIRFQVMMDGLNGAGFSGRHFLRTGSQTNDGGANLTPDFTLNVEFIPEPASVLLFGLGLIGVCTVRRR